MTETKKESNIRYNSQPKEYSKPSPALEERKAMCPIKTHN
jgi:hypothetical protein